ncbi:retrovirus-related pol polyprotein from transposon TNT 1-94 [Tanacetum coccineum]
MEYDPSDVEFAEWLASKFYNHMTMDRYTKNALWIYWKRGDNEVELIDEEFSDPDDDNLIDKDEVAEIFRLKTNIFDFETPICMAFNKFNYLINIDTDLLTNDILGFKTYNEFKNEWRTNRTKEYHGFPRNHGLNMELLLITFFLFVNLSISRMGKQNGTLVIRTKMDSAMEENYRGWFELVTWPTFKSMNDVSRTFNNHEGRNDDEVIQEEREPNNDHRIGNLYNDMVWDNVSYHTNEEEEQYKEDRCELLGNPRQEPLVFKIGRFEVIKYSFGLEEKHIAIKECEHDDWTRTKEDACHAYQGIFRIMDERWFVTRAE